MTLDLNTMLIAFLGGSFLMGLAALRKSGKEADNLAAQAAANVVSAADDVVVLMRSQMADMDNRIDGGEKRILHLEVAVGAWESWAEKVLELLDRSLAMLASEQAAKLADDVAEVKRTKPVRKRMRKEESTT